MQYNAASATWICIIVQVEVPAATGAHCDSRQRHNERDTVHPHVRNRTASSDFAPAQVDVERRATVACSALAAPLGDHARCLGEHLERWAQARPEQVFLAERDDAGAWQRLTYAQALQQVRACAAALLVRDLGPHRPLAILSDNSITHALLTLAAMHVGVPVAPISPAYSLMSRDFGRLRAAAALLQPGLVYVEDPQRFAPALQAVDWQGAELVCGPQHPPPAGFTSCAQLLATTADAEVERAYHTVGPDTIAKILLTSGSTGEPKGVINTQRMLCQSAAAAAGWPFVTREPPLICDWLPNHTRRQPPSI